MFLRLFEELRAAGVPVSLKEHLALLEALDKRVIGVETEAFYHLARAILVKDERNLDKFDRVFARVFDGVPTLDPALFAGVPAEWLKALSEKHLSEEEKALIESMGGWDALLEAFRKRLAEQKERHAGGNKMIGTAGTSPFGAYGYNPEGMRIGQDRSRHGRAVKVWDRREYKNLDDSVELGTRNIKVALRRLRKWARTGAESELDLPATIRGTAHKGYLDVKLMPERHNAAKVLLFFDAGGSMETHVKLCEELFSAARAEFKHMDFFYFHNCLYESVWKDNRRRHEEKLATLDVLHTYGPDYRVIVVGDATMSPYEITQAGGSVEHWNEEAGAVWLDRLARTWPHLAWLNPVAEKHWTYTPSVALISRLLGGRMFPLTLTGLDAAMKALNR